MTSTLVLAAGLVVIASGFTYAQLRSTRENIDDEMDSLAATVDAPLTTEVRQWLAPQLERRTLYPGIGLVWGIALASLLVTDGWYDAPWYWFSTLVGAGFGLVLGQLVAAYRTTPPPLGAMRTADPVGRRVATSFSRPRRLMLRTAVVIAAATLATAVALDASSSSDTAGRAVLVSGVILVLAVTDYVAIAVVLARPVRSSTPEGRAWQKALLARSVGETPRGTLFSALFGVGVVGYTTALELDDLPAVMTALTALLVGGPIAATAVAALVHRRPHRAGPAEFIGGRATP
ncbi:hypothetical protein GCM10023340_10980 [Nocardioides marinquilinus]|uniref:Uncharacterized protein n=1 Tax=Nocardioides marinquilinus TaxID=1210400 RepID=A0ABP9PBV8_9ACTN